MAHKIYIVSPQEPSGATWLINCFLELGIKTYRKEDSNWMWQLQKDNSYRLNPIENILKKWLPILSRKETHVFRKDIEVEWVHDWPRNRFKDSKIIYFVRDPRDAIYSRYKRSNSPLTFQEYVFFPDIYTLVNKIDTWVLFNKTWLNFINNKFFRFEDYKADASSLLSKILDYCELEYDNDSISIAIHNSTSDKAAKAESEFKANNTSDTTLINRGGMVGGWKFFSGTDLETVQLIEYKCRELLTEFGYSLHFDNIKHPEIIQLQCKEMLNDTFLEQLDPSTNNITTPIIEIHKKQYNILLNEKIFKVGLDNSEIAILHTNIEAYINSLHLQNDKQFEQIFSGSSNSHHTHELIQLRSTLLFNYKYASDNYKYLLLKKLIKKTFSLFGEIPLKLYFANLISKLK